MTSLYPPSVTLRVLECAKLVRSMLSALPRRLWDGAFGDAHYLIEKLACRCDACGTLPRGTYRQRVGDRWLCPSCAAQAQAVRVEWPPACECKHCGEPLTPPGYECVRRHLPLVERHVERFHRVKGREGKVTEDRCHTYT